MSPPKDGGSSIVNWLIGELLMEKSDEDMYRPCGRKPDVYFVRPAGREMLWK